MSELIARTRLQREAKALQRDVQMDATDRLDERLKTLMSQGAFGNAIATPRAKGERPERKANNDVYDLLVSAFSSRHRVCPCVNRDLHCFSYPTCGNQRVPVASPRVSV